MTKALYLLGSDCFAQIYPPAIRQAIEASATMVGPPQTSASIKENLALLREVEVIFSGWGCPQFDAAFLAAAPQLKVLFYGAGSVRGIITDATWERGVQVTNANYANGLSVAEYTLATILLASKQALQLGLATKLAGHYPAARGTMAGNYRSVVGLVSLGQIGLRVAKLLQAFDHQVIAYDPFCPPATAAALGVTLVPLADLFARADVVSLHTPWLPETVGMITGALVRAMKPHATFINTARGAVVNEPELIAALQDRPDLFAVLDVTWPEPPAADSPLWRLPNVLLTPHIAGSLGPECARHGRQMLEEFQRYLRGEPLQYLITRAAFAHMA